MDRSRGRPGPFAWIRDSSARLERRVADRDPGQCEFRRRPRPAQLSAGLADADEAETAKAASRQRLSDVKSFLGRDRVHVNSGCRTRRHCVDGWSLTSGNEVEALGNRTQHSS